MFVYLDESGDTGFKFQQGSTRYFVITLLLVNDPIPIQSAIDELRLSLGWQPRDEFKFSKVTDYVRTRFLNVLLHQNFRTRVLIIDKQLMTRPYMRNSERFYNYLVKLILTHDDGSIAGATLVLDESTKNKRVQRELGAYLKRALNNDPAAPKVSKIVHHASHSDNLIQATDMICGAVYAAYHRNNGKYLTIVRPKIVDLWVWHPYEAQ